MRILQIISDAIPFVCKSLHFIVEKIPTLFNFHLANGSLLHFTKFRESNVWHLQYNTSLVAITIVLPIEISFDLPNILSI